MNSIQILCEMIALSLYYQLYLFGGLVVLGFAEFDSQQTVPLLQELVLCTILAGFEHSEDMD